MLYVRFCCSCALLLTRGQILDELLMAGEMQEPSRDAILQVVRLFC